jgi:hypothetical protein
MDISNRLESIAVMGWYGGDISTDLKRAALCFDKVAIRHVHRQAECDMFSATEAGERTVKSITWLRENDATVPWPAEVMPDDDFQNRVPAPVFNSNPKLFEELNSVYRKNKMTALRVAMSGEGEIYDPDPNQDAAGYQSKDLAVRAAALYFRLVETQNAVPLVDQLFLPTRPEEARCVDVAHVMFAAMPDADAATSWEAIREFRADREMRDRLISFRNWISHRVAQGVQLDGIVDEMSENLFEYERYMRQQHRKVNLGVMETIVTTAAEIVEDALKLKLSKLAKTVFSIRKGPMQLLEAELQAPGKEMAYLSHVYERFRPETR